ncbi:hypothetical protein PC110_g18179 [Phytophthora cactorum]|uniref:Uncharacterized protein n=1 Tax=Phytophthora cactorum TaxID=29920 RepID=A0A329RM46_9STRA|nr:hypothetical protein PC110_g18179 [Phytophthora cactorum]
MTRGKRIVVPGRESAAKRRCRTRAQDVDTASPRRDTKVDFKGIWRIRRRNGWSTKRPTFRSLDPRYRYIPPAGSADRQEGRDYFWGEDAVVNYFRSKEGVDTEEVNGGDSTSTSVRLDHLTLSLAPLHERDMEIDLDLGRVRKLEHRNAERHRSPGLRYFLQQDRRSTTLYLRLDLGSGSLHDHDLGVDG